MFSEGIEVEHWLKMSQCSSGSQRQKYCQSYISHASYQPIHTRYTFLLLKSKILKQELREAKSF